MIKVYQSPDFYKVPVEKDNGGIRRVCEAIQKHLPIFGIEVVHHPEKAHVIANHGGSPVSVPGIPSVNINHGFM